MWHIFHNNGLVSFTGVNYNEVRHVTNGRRSVMPDYYFIRKLFDLEKEGCECLNNRNLTIKHNIEIPIVIVIE